MQFPSIVAISFALGTLKRHYCKYPEDSIDIRLQVGESGVWTLRIEGSKHATDTDCTMYWGESSINPDTDCAALAKDLLDQCREHYYQCQLRG